MEIDTLKRIIREQEETIKSKLAREDIIEREFSGYAAPFLKHPNALAILGIRRCGKSIFSCMLAGKLSQKPAYINFDDERLAEAKTEDLNKVLQAFYELYGDPDVIILDEIQNVPGWELFVSRTRETKKVIITGSNSKMLGGELSTHLTGRHIDLQLYPFSFREAITFKPDTNLTVDVAKARNEFKKYVEGSGFPEYRNFGRSIISSIYEDIINKDCIRRYNIKNESTFKELSRYMISNFSHEFTYSKLSKIFGIRDIHTTKNYVSYIQEAFLIVIIERYSRSLKQQFIAPRKVYAMDHGLCNFISFRSDADLGRMYENIVCTELLRRASAEYGTKIYYWKDHSGKEVDFVVKKGRSIDALIQVCYEINAENIGREAGNLISAGRELSCKRLIIITDNREGVETHGDNLIRFVPLWKWLLGLTESPDRQER
jgi:hypothetical protein